MDADPALRRRLALRGTLLAVGTLAALLLLGWGQLAAFRDPFVPWQEDAALLLGSSWGTWWKAGVGGSVLVTLLLVMPPLRTPGFLLAPILAAYPSVSGHAAGVEGWGPLPVLADWVHVLAAGGWLGALAALVTLRQWGAAPGSGSLLVRHLERFSLLARGSVVLLVLTGAFASWLHLSAPPDLWTHPYGRILLAKLALVGVLLAVGAWNWRRLSPLAGTEEGAARLVRSARREAALGVVVVILTAWLTGTAPPG